MSTKTAIRRRNLSVPYRTLLQLNKVGKDPRILDFGCGMGDDVRVLRGIGYDADGYDVGTRSPAEFRVDPVGPYDLVGMIYVLNTLKPIDRKMPLDKAWLQVKPGGRMFIATRTHRDIQYEAKRGGWKLISDGYQTPKGTFQRGFDHSELVLINYHLHGESIIAHEIIRTPDFTGVMFVKRSR